MTSRNADRAATEAIVKDAITGAAVSAFARGIALAVHVDHRLPATVSGQAAAVTEFLRQGLLRTVEAGRTGTIALALWRVEGETGPAIELEVGRSFGPGGAPAARLADLWSFPLAGLPAAPAPRRRDARGETVTIPLPLTPDPEALPLGDAWRPAFQGHSMLHVGELLLDPGGFCASLESIGLDVEMVATAEEALSTAGARADAQRPFDVLLIHEMPLEAAEELARAFRADPRLAGTLIAFAGVGKEEAPRLGEVPLFDAVRSPARPWRRMIVMIRDLLEARAHRAAHRAAHGAAHGAAPRPAEPPGEAGIPDLGGSRILVAEDVETNQVLLRAFLEPTGARIETVSDGAAAIERHAASPADLILMDLQMPGIDGITAARRIRALPPPAGEVPIVALTAYAASPDRQRALAAGMDAYLAKPVVMSELHELVLRLLRSGAETG